MIHHTVSCIVNVMVHWSHIDCLLMILCSLAISELLEDNLDDDGSLGLGLGEEKYFTGVKLSGEKL